MNTTRQAMMRAALAAALLACGLGATAGAAPKKKGAPKPAAAAPAAPADDGEKPVAGGDAGTTIVGEQESPIGLYITPWKDEYAEHGLDRPARFLDEELQPIDKATFQRQVDYFAKIDEWRRKHPDQARPQ